MKHKDLNMVSTEKVSHSNAQQYGNTAPLDTIDKEKAADTQSEFNIIRFRQEHHDNA